MRGRPLRDSSTTPEKASSEASREATASTFNAPGACLCLRFAHYESLLVNEIDLLPPQFAQFLVAQAAVQVHHKSRVATHAARPRGVAVF